MIPKILHYCWYGDNPLSDINKECLASWQRLMPDYEIKKWHEGNSKMDLPFMKEAYEQKRYGYLIDHTRLFALDQFGGIFLDLDFMALKSFDTLLKHDFFLGMIDNNQVGMGIIGCQTGNLFIRDLKNIYESYPGFVDKPSTEVATNYFNSQGLKNSYNQVSDTLGFYPCHIFYNFTLGSAYRNEPYLDHIHPESIAIHLWENTWIKPEFRDFWFGYPKKGYKKAFKRIITNPVQGVHYYKDLAYHILRHLKIKK